MAVIVDGSSLTIDQVDRVSRHGEVVVLGDAVIQCMTQSRSRVEQVLARGDAVYGLSTGLGERKRVRVDQADIGTFNQRLIESHRVGTGAWVADEVVRATMLCMVNGFATGTSGVRALLAQRLVGALNDGHQARVRALGSVGVGDLAPLADLAADVFAGTALEANEGLALVNTNSFSTGLAANTLVDARRLVETMSMAGALDLEAFAANLSILDPAVASARPYPGLVSETEALRTALQHSHLWRDGSARNLQDPLSYRSIAHVHGVARDALSFAETQVGVELNAHDSNPLVVPGQDRVISVGCYDSLPVATALDFLRVALAPSLTCCLERSAKLLQAPMSGLPSGLSPLRGQAHSGLAELLWSMHALTVEARQLAQPVSFEIATTTGEEGLADRITMAPLAARRLAEQIDLGWRILAIEMVISAQAIDLRNPPRLGEGTAAAHARIRDQIPFTSPHTPFPTDLEAIADIARTGALLEPRRSGDRTPTQAPKAFADSPAT